MAYLEFVLLANTYFVGLVGESGAVGIGRPRSTD